MSGWGAIYRNTSYALASQTQKLAQLQEEGSTGYRVNQASDSPQDAYRILHLQSQSQACDTYSKNLDTVTMGLQSADNVLTQTSSTLTQIQQILSQASSATYAGSDRQTLGTQVDSLLEQVVSLANTENAGQYVMAGDKTSSPPYTVQRVDGRIVSVQYQGGASGLATPVAPGVTYSGTVVGPSAFQSDSRQAPVFLGSTGAKAGSQTSTVTGDAWLTIAHDSTTFPPASQLAAGTSTAQDTALGTHTITISASGKTIQLDGGPAVSFQGTERDLALQNENGDTIHVDLSGWTDADGQFTIQSTGTLSLDDGATSVPLTSGANVAVTDSRTGKILYVDTTQIQHPGLEPVRVPGTYDVFSTLISIRDLMLNQKDLPVAQQQSLLNSAMDSLKEVAGQVRLNQTAVGANLQAMDNLKQSLSDQKSSQDAEASNLQAADITQVAAELASMQNLYQMTLASAAKLLNISLLSYIQ